MVVVVLWCWVCVRFSVVKTYCGHGIGDLFHCAPNIPHYAHNKAVGIMKEGMVRHKERGGGCMTNLPFPGGCGAGAQHTRPLIASCMHCRACWWWFLFVALQVFTIEPMVNAGTWRDVLWPDGWTAVTRDGSRSAQFEHQLVVTDNGCEVLTARTPNSPPLWWEQ